MRIPLTLIALLLFWSPARSFAQGQQQPESPQAQKPSTPVAGCKLSESFDLLSYESAGADLKWHGHFHHFREDSHDLKSTSQASADLRSWLEKSKGTGTGETLGGLLGPCHADISRYAPALINLLDGLRYEVAGLLYSDNDIPFRVFAKEKSEGVLLSVVTSEQIYNTLKLNARQRAAKEFDSTAVPILREMRSALSQSPAQFYGVIILWGARDFSENGIGSQLFVDNEELAVVTDRDNCRNLDEGKITEDEFADKSDIYLLSESGANLVKIKLKFE